jgi:hypothetical protein
MSAEYERQPEQHDTRDPNEETRWISLAGGVIVWTLHLMLVYPMTSLVCERNLLGLADQSIVGLPAVRAIQVIVTIIALALIAVAALAAWRDWKGMHEGRGAGIDDADDSRAAFLTFISIALNVVFFITVLVSLLPILVLPTCAG